MLDPRNIASTIKSFIHLG